MIFLLFAKVNSLQIRYTYIKMKRATTKERTLKKALIYFLAFMVGGIIGILILGHIPDSLSFLSNGPLNFPIFGAIGFGICAIVYKEYKKLLLVPVIAFVIGLALLVFLFQGG